MIGGEGGSSAAASYDVTKSVQCAAMVDDAVSRWGRLDCLDNNVGIGSRGPVVEETEENWARVMQVNVDTMFLTCKHAIPAMIRTAGGGLSEQARYITGQVLGVDGGATLVGPGRASQ